MKESDEEMLHKIQRIEMIKHCPNHWHLEFFDPMNMFNILGGTGTALYSGIGAGLAVVYFRNSVQHQTFNLYSYNMRMLGRAKFGMLVGLAAGYMQFGDRQRLHNAWVAERLRRRYPDSKSLQASDLYTLKGKKAGHEFYKWT